MIKVKPIRIKWYYKDQQGEYFDELGQDLYGDFSVYWWESNFFDLYDDYNLDCGDEIRIQIYDLDGNCLLDELED